MPSPVVCGRDGREMNSKLNLVDLAGSERLSKTGAQGVVWVVAPPCPDRGMTRCPACSWYVRRDLNVLIGGQPTAVGGIPAGGWRVTDGGWRVTTSFLFFQGDGGRVFSHSPPSRPPWTCVDCEGKCMTPNQSSHRPAAKPFGPLCRQANQVACSQKIFGCPATGPQRRLPAPLGMNCLFFVVATAGRGFLGCM